MECITILAQTARASSHAGGEAQIVPIDFIYQQITTLSWFQAIVAISFGVVYLLYGWRVFKVLAVISFAMVGLYVGMRIGRTLGSELFGGVAGLVVLALLSIPLMRWAVSILGAVAGGILTAGLWYAFELPQQYIWAGGMIGFVAGGMISFIVFKIAVMLFSSLGGAMLIVTGILALLHLYGPTTEMVNNSIHNSSWFLPMALLLPTIGGVLMQNKLVKGARDWNL